MSVKEILGVYSSRPELRGPSSSAIQNFEDQVWKMNLESHLQQCSSTIWIEERCSRKLSEAGFNSSETPFLFHIEKTLMDLSSPSLTDGTFYCSLFQIGSLHYCRFFESGVLSGYFLSEGIRLIKSQLSELGDNDDDNLMWCQVSTIEDIKQYQERYSKNLERKRSHRSISNSTNVIGLKFQSLMTKNEQGIVKAHRKLMAKAQTSDASDSCRLIGTVISVIKRNSHKEKDQLKARFFETSGHFHHHLHTWENSVQTFRIDGVHSEPLLFSTLFSPPSSSRFTIHEQCSVLSAIPNNHYWDAGQCAHVGYSRMLSVRDQTGKHKPASVRNAVLLNYREDNFGEILRIVKKYRGLDSHINYPSITDIHLDTATTTTTTSDGTAVTRSVGPRRRALTEEDIMRNVHILNPSFSTANRASEKSSYSLFKTALVECGHMLWQIHQEDKDILVMNDVNINTGMFCNNSYVHLTRTNIGEDIQYSCTCKLYSTLLQIATLNDEDSNIDSVNIRCCHIRFFQDEILPDLDIYFSKEPLDFPTKIQTLVLNSLKAANNKICPLLSDSKSKKFSVLHNNNVEFVHIFNNRLACQSGECQALYGCSQRKVVYLDMTSNICPHLAIMQQNKNIWLQEEVMELDEEEDLETELFDHEQETTEDEVTFDPTGNFNLESGLWCFQSRSCHRPKDEDDPALKRSIQRRLAIFDGAEEVSRDSEGVLVGVQPFLLCPPLDQENCNCGAGYFNTNNPNGVLSDVKYRPLVYMSNGPARFEVRNRDCLGRSLQCSVEYSGTYDCLHFLSKETAAGDEIGYDYLDHALHTHITFSAFCKLFNRKYKRNFSTSSNFMSPQTFIAWWFSWSSQFKIDFRRTCHICKHNPKALACDGTKIGINFRHADIQAIETPNSLDLVDPCHQRNDRCFLHFNKNKVCNDKSLLQNIQKSRDHLLYLAKRVLGLIHENDVLPQQILTNNNELLIEMADKQCSNVLQKFAISDYPNPLQKNLAVVFKILSSNHSLSSFIPFRYTDLLQNVLLNITVGDPAFGYNRKISLVGEFSPEIREVLFSSLCKRSVLREMVCFFEYLISRVRHIASLNKESPPAESQPGTYNPEKNGVAYYFTESGNKLRDIPIYTMNDKAYSKNYDEVPYRPEDNCNKIYPEVSKKGTTYLFLWFDPKHYGHCYGFHMIPGSEGRKDPFSSAFCYLENAPSEVFYDFACQLEEYCLNREPDFWKNTRFFHDLFHGYSHKCPCIYKSQRLVPLQKLNTEICEQFNSFIQKIKYSARSMSLSKFCYYLQFMIFQWCELKRKAFERRCGVALNYLA